MNAFVPSKEQEALLEFVASGSGHGLGIARAGSGKTTVVVQALKRVPPGLEVLCCAFNASIRDKLLTLVPPHVRVRSIHQLGRDTLRAYPNFRRFKHDEDDVKGREMAALALEGSPYAEAVEHAERGPERREVMERFLELRNAVAEGAALVKATCTTTRAELLELVKTYGLDVTDDPNEVAGYIATAVRNALADWPRTNFDDEVWLPVHYGLALRQYDVVFVDEVQDLTRTQVRLVLSAVREGGRVIAVGDPCQTLYQFRGADVSTFSYFKEVLHAAEFPLSVSYRCPRRVVEHVKPYVPDIQSYEGAAEGEVTRIEVNDLYVRVRPGDFVLSRVNAMLAPVSMRLLAAGIPARIVGAADLGRSLVALVRRSRKKDVGAFNVWLEGYVESETERLKDNVRALEALTDKVETLRTFFPTTLDPEESIEEAITRMNAFFAEQSRRHQGKQVILSTVHRLKGDEAQNVFLLESTFFLSRGDPQEERNIYYVAATRAQKTLYCVGDRRSS